MTFGYLSWRKPDGTLVALNNQNDVIVTIGAVGLDAPPPTNTIEDYIAFDGAALTNRRQGARPIALPLWVRHATRVQTRISELVAMFRAGGQLVHNDGVDNRTLKNVIYDGGLGGDDSNVRSTVERRTAVSLLALDPWWYGTAVAQPLAVAAATAFDAGIAFSSAIPFDGGSSVPFTVVGDTDAYPVITVQGPATTVTVGNGTLEWVTAVALGASDVLVVDTRPGGRGPRLNGGAVNWALLTPASRLWTLPKGAVSIVSGVVGSTGATTVTLSYEPRFETR